MTDRTIAEKLRFKPGMKASVLFAPSGVDLGIPADALVDESADADFILLFASTQASAEESIRMIASNVREKTVAWIGYPKGSKAKGLDISRDTIGKFVLSVGLIVNANFSIDDTWSAVRVRPLKEGDKSPFA
jgi:hypothetical protein